MAAEKFGLGDYIKGSSVHLLEPVSGPITAIDPRGSGGCTYCVGGVWVDDSTVEFIHKAPIMVQPEGEAAFVALAKALGYEVRKVG